MMQRYAFLLLCLINLKGYAQNFSARVNDFRNKYKADFLKDARSPLKEDDLQYLRFYEPDSSYSVVAQAEILANQGTFVMPVFSGNGKEYARYAVLSFALKGKPFKLTVYKSIALTMTPEYADYLFLPFTDETNGNDTYGGGRYIDLRTKDFKNGTVVIDFNKAYNPYCAFSSGYQCPKPPDENALYTEIKAGEKKFGKAH